MIFWSHCSFFSSFQCLFHTFSSSWLLAAFFWVSSVATRSASLPEREQGKKEWGSKRYLQVRPRAKPEAACSTSLREGESDILLLLGPLLLSDLAKLSLSFPKKRGKSIGLSCGRNSTDWASAESRISTAGCICEKKKSLLSLTKNVSVEVSGAVSRDLLILWVSSVDWIWSGPTTTTRLNRANRQTVITWRHHHHRAHHQRHLLKRRKNNETGKYLMHQELFFKGLKADRAERESQNKREAKCFERVFSLIIQKWENCFLTDVHLMWLTLTNGVKSGWTYEPPTKLY